MRSLVLVSVLSSLTLLSAGCLKTDPLACQDACSHQEVRTFCDIDKAYPGTELENECIVPPSADACNRIETCTLEGKPHCTDESAGVCVQCLNETHCDGGEICDPSSNSCVVLTCEEGEAGDALCAGSTAGSPYCLDERCVECRQSSDCTSATKPVCDEDSNECRGCTKNNECDSGVCDVDAGECAEESTIVYVAKTGVDNGECGTNAAPCLTIATGLDQTGVGRTTMVVRAGEYDEKVTISEGSVTLVGEGAVVKPGQVANLADNEFALQVSGGATVDVSGFTIDGSNGDVGSNGVGCQNVASALEFREGEILGARDVGLDVDGCSVVVTSSTISGSDGIGVSATGGSVTVTSSTISGNGGGGLSISSADFEVVNNFIIHNGAQAAQVGGASLSGASDTRVFEFNTVSGNQVGVDASGVECSLIPALVARNSIVSGGIGGASIGGNCTWEYSSIQGSPVTPGTGNINSEPLFVNASAIDSDYHLQSTSPCIDAADPAATLTSDIDGQVRPQGAGRDMGADEAG